MEAFLVIFLIALINAALSSELAKQKGHSSTKWFLYGLVLGPLGMLAAVGLSDLKLRSLLKDRLDQ